MNEMMTFLNKWFDSKIKSLQLKKTVAAKVISVTDGYKKALVELTNGTQITLLNKTGEKLCEGDSVWVEYRTKPSSGVVAMRNGECDPLGGTGGDGSITYVGSLLVATPQQASTYYLNGSEIAKVAAENSAKKIYGAKNRYMVVNGQCGVWCASVNAYQSIAQPADLLDHVNAHKNLDYRDNRWYYAETVPKLIPRITSMEYNQITIRGFTEDGASGDNTGCTFSEIPAMWGVVMIVTGIVETFPGHTHYSVAPYGYAKAYHRVAGFDNSGALIKVDNYEFAACIEYSLAQIPFASQAEFDAAMNLKVTIEAQQSEAVELTAETLQG